MSRIFYALGLHMHQPPANLELLIKHNEWEAQQIIRCYERAARYALLYPRHGRLHVGFSGILLEQFQDPALIEQYKKFVDIPHMLELYRRAENIEFIGMGYYHPIFPLIPKDDWPEQLEKGWRIVEQVFGRRPTGFWPSEMAFSMEMIPYLVEAGYEYVIVDHVHVRAKKSDAAVDCYRPYYACYDKARITIIPRQRDLSNAQESGLNPGWFLDELGHKLNGIPAKGTTRLVTTWSDGENGGWFRQLDERSGFFGYFFAPLVDKIMKKETGLQFCKLSDYIKKCPPQQEAVVNTGAWNVASTSGYDFAQWNGSESQKKAIKALFDVSRRYWELRDRKMTADKKKDLARARQLILDAETSCYLFWGEAWLPKLYEKTAAAEALFSKI